MQNNSSNNLNKGQTTVPFPDSYYQQFSAEQTNLSKVTTCTFASAFDEPWMPTQSLLDLRYHDDRGGKNMFWNKVQRKIDETTNPAYIIPYKIPRFTIPDDAMQVDKPMW